MPILVRLLFLILVLPVLISAQGTTAFAGNLQRFLDKLDLKQVYPAAETIGALEGNPPVAVAAAGGKKIGYVFLNSDFAGATGYSGKPIHVLVGLDLNGVVTGAQLVEHHEPIVLIGIPEKRIRTVIDGYAGRDATALARDDSWQHDIDIVSGATVTVMVIDDSILRSAIKVARRYGLGGLQPDEKAGAGPSAEVDMGKKSVRDWAALAGEGSVRSLNLSVGQINKAFERSGDTVAAQRAEQGAPQDTFINLSVALVSVPTIGASLLGANEYRNLKKKLGPKQHAILLAGQGRYSFRGSGFVRGGLFDRIQLIQGDNSVRFRDKNYKRLRKVAAEGAPDFTEVALFTIPDTIPFDPAEPWRIELLVGRATGPTDKAFLTFDLSYRLPAKYLKRVQPAPASETAWRTAPDANAGAAPAVSGVWKRLWKQKTGQLVVLMVALTILTAIFFFQDWLARRPRLTEAVRIGFLTFTLFGIGFYANAQLSVVNVMTFFNSLITNFHWEYFLLEPLIFTIWVAVAASLMFWGRGAFCGWLCPFGALQELLNRVAKAIRIPQVTVPWGLHERVWAFKYMLFLALFGVSLYSLSLAEQLAEVEPFKTAIILKFAREWPYVLFAVLLLAAGLFIERFYCRYLCPLGAALAIPGKFRLFEWLKRYKQCGSPCQRCAVDCMVQAIHPEGQINPNECLYCLHCQVLYHDAHRCPVVIQRRLRQERRDLPPLARISERIRRSGRSAGQRRTEKVE